MSQPGGPHDTDRTEATRPARPEDGASVEENAATEARRSALKLGEQAKQHARGIADRQKSAAADQVRGFADVLHRTSEGLREQNYGMVGEYADQAARGLEGFAQTLREKDLDGLVEDVGDFARRQPALFLGGAVALGFAMSRFLKTSGNRRGGGEQYGERFDEDRASYRYRRATYRPSDYPGPDYAGQGGERPVPGTVTSGSGGTTAGSTAVGGEMRDAGASPGADQTTTGGSHGAR